MQTETRIQEDPGLASRYLAGQLSRSELQAYQQHLLENPAAVQELEATALMKVGLANLRETRQLEHLLQTRNIFGWLWPALAAAAALIVVAIGLLRAVDAPLDTTLVATASELMDRSGRPLAAGSSYALLRTRSTAYDVVIELPPEPRAIELRVRPEAQASAYSVDLSRIHPDTSATQIGSVEGVRAQADGFVLYVDSSRLETAPYLLVITPAHDRSPASGSEFRVKVTDPDTQP